ncbi:MAG: methionyl-tRNA formyltransferase [Candidatus Binatia bacterium]|nr:methionyl-tRNA formyltransferase [Candidatus Binatia bacterium]
MRIVLFGQAAFGQRVLVGLRDCGHDIAAVYAPAPRGDRADPLAAEAEKAGVPLHTPPSYKTPEVEAQVKAAEADVGVLAFVTKIIPQAVIDAPKHGSICFHPSLLPRYRGGSALAWQLITGETRGGFTVFWTDPGIDTGPILLQEEIEISPDDTGASLYFDKIFEPGIAGMVESVDLIAAGKAPRVAQDESEATYEPLCRDEHGCIHWNQPTKKVYDLIRGCDPQPGAHARAGGEQSRLYGAKRGPAPDSAVPAGTVVSVGDGGLTVAVGSGADAGTLTIAKMRVGKEKLPAAEAAQRLGLSVGAAFGDGEV